MSFSQQIVDGDALIEAPAGTLFLLTSVSLGEPQCIPLDSWLALAVDVRAPARSVVVVKVEDDSFSAAVIDTAAGQLRWLVTGERTQLPRLHEGMLGEQTDNGVVRTPIGSGGPPGLTQPTFS